MLITVRGRCSLKSLQFGGTAMNLLMISDGRFDTKTDRNRTKEANKYMGGISQDVKRLKKKLGFIPLFFGFS